MSLESLAARVRAVNAAGDRARRSRRRAGLYEVVGDVMDAPEGAVVAFLANDATATWGGGVARQVARRDPAAQREFRARERRSASALKLGSCELVSGASGRTYAVLIAQEGVGAQRRLRLDALATALARLAQAVAPGCDVHMPRIGAVAGRGSWEAVEHVVRSQLSRRLTVVVHRLPARGAVRRVRDQAER